MSGKSCRPRQSRQLYPQIAADLLHCGELTLRAKSRNMSWLGLVSFACERIVSTAPIKHKIGASRMGSSGNLRQLNSVVSERIVMPRNRIIARQEVNRPSYLNTVSGSLYEGYVGICRPLCEVR